MDHGTRHTKRVLPIGNIPRRRFLQWAGAGLALSGLSHWGTAGASKPIRVAMTPAFLNDQHSLLADWRIYLQNKLGVEVEFVQRDSYRETMDLLQQGKLEFAWICDYPFVYLKETVRLVAVPLNKGRPYYQSYLIVSADDWKRKSMADLKGAVFAYADPYSNTGYLTPRFRIRQLGGSPETFFRKTFFTWSHRKVVEAVVKGYADGGAVDSFVWDSLEKIRPEITGATRVIERSPEFGFPPFVAHRTVGAAEFQRMQAVLLGMQDDKEGRQLLQRLNLDGFAAGQPSLYNSVADMMRVFGEH